MDNNEFDKYVQYVIAQVGEGNHSKDEIKEDLSSRGLSHEEVDEVVDEAFNKGSESEDEARKGKSLLIIMKMAIPILMCILMWLSGLSIIKSCSFSIIIGSLFSLIRVKFLKKKFK